MAQRSRYVMTLRIDKAGGESPYNTILANSLYLRENKATKILDDSVEAVGKAVSWIWIILISTILANVILRYVFKQGMIELEELQWHLYAIGWVVGLSMTAKRDAHVRVDIIHSRLNHSAQVWLELFGLVFLFLPFILFVFVSSIPFFELSWLSNETSTSANGLPARWFIKGVLVFGFFLLLLIGVSRLLRVLISLPIACKLSNIDSDRNQ